MVQLPCALTECEVVLVRNCQDRDGLNLDAVWTLKPEIMR
jgi:hypothetical protein